MNIQLDMVAAFEDFEDDDEPKEQILIYNGVNQDDGEKRVNFAPDEIIVKFKPTSLVAHVVDKMVKEKRPLSTLTNSDYLDSLNETHNVTSMKKVFKEFDASYALPRGAISKATARKINADYKKARSEKIDKMRSKFPDKADKIQPSLPDLGGTYVVKFEKGEDGDIDVMAVCKDYQKSPHVEYAQPRYMYEMSPDDPYFRSRGSWGQDYDDLYALKEETLDCEPAWEIAQGEGVVVAVIDTGVDYSHDDIEDNIWINIGREDEEGDEEIPDNNRDDDNNGYIDDYRGYDFSGNERKEGEIVPDNDPSDYHGHGTHCAGTIAAVANRIGIIGVAPRTKIMPLKIFPYAYSDICAEAIMYAADNGADVLSCSWGKLMMGDMRFDPIVTEAIDYAYGLDCTLVFAAGNDNLNVMYFTPANYSKTIAVAATDHNDEKAEFSNWGGLIDVSAPGTGILSLRAEGTDMYHDGVHIVDGNYYWANGTSMACPHVAGLVALILFNNPGFSNGEVRTIMRVSADDIGNEGFDIYFGHGRINANEALQIDSACTVRIDSPCAGEYERDELGIVEITGTASGESFQSYRLLRTVNAFEDEWVQIGDVNEEEVVDDVLSELDMRIAFDEGEAGFYLKLIVTDNDDNTFEDIEGPFIITPFGISTVEELQNMRSFLFVSYYLTNDIDASETADWNDGAGFDPIGCNIHPFTGSFDGNDHIITNLTINRPEESQVGLFGETWDTIVQNVGLVNVNVTGHRYVAGLVGRAFREVTINCYVTGAVTGRGTNIGGLIGNATLTNFITNCYSTANVTGDRRVGGLLGSNYDRLMINNSYATGDVAGSTIIGGLVGSSGRNSTIINCYATGDVIGDNSIGGLLGYASGRLIIMNSYAAGRVTGRGDYVAGFIGHSDAGEYSNNFWDIETTEQERGLGGDRERNGISGRTTQEMYDRDTYESWDFENIWYMPDPGNDYPHLRQGTVYGIPIYNVQELQAIENDVRGYYYLANDIDASETAEWHHGMGFEPIGIDRLVFSGNFNGNGHVIRNLTINRPDENYVALFGKATNGTIENVGMLDIDITGHWNVGGLVGYNHKSPSGKGKEGYIINCYVTGEVNGQNRVGGLTGYSGIGYRGGYISICTISNCYAEASVACRDTVAGGLVGFSGSNSTIINCYATGSVSAIDYKGGLVGTNSGTISNCYAVGSVTGRGDNVGGLVGYSAVPHEAYSDNYFDIETTGQEYGVQRGDELEIAGVTGEPTERMMQQQTYENWDFDELWRIDEGNDYPRFGWELEIEEEPQDVEQTIELIEGWNLISFNVDIGGMNVRDVFAPLIEGAVDVNGGVLIMVKDSGGMLWSRFGYSMEPLSIEYAYHLKVNRDAMLIVEAPPIQYPVTITLEPGWNFMGYPAQDEGLIEEVFEELLEEEKISMIKDGDGRFCAPSYNFYGFRTLEPGKGYLIEINGEEDVSFELTE